MPIIGSFAIGIGVVGIADGVVVSVGYQQLPLTTSVGLDVPAGATFATIVAEGAAVRYRDDGQKATEAVGMPIGIGERLHYVGNLSALQFAAQAIGAILNVLYYSASNPTGD